MAGRRRQSAALYPRLPAQIDSMDAVRRWIDGYDTGIRYADRHVGMLLDELRAQGVLDDLVIIVSSDHGENQGELNVWGDHQTADHITSRVPLIMRWPGVTAPASRDAALHYHFDWAATLIELLGGQVPANWDGVPFTQALKENRAEGREALVVSQAAWSCMRSVRFYHEGEDLYLPAHLSRRLQRTRTGHALQPDPRPARAARPGRRRRGPTWCKRPWPCWPIGSTRQMLTSTTDVDPLMTVLREGGPFHTRGTLPRYAAHLRATGRAQHAARLERRHPHEI